MSITFTSLARSNRQALAYTIGTMAIGNDLLEAFHLLSDLFKSKHERHRYPPLSSVLPGFTGRCFHASNLETHDSFDMLISCRVQTGYVQSDTKDNRFDTGLYISLHSMFVKRNLLLRTVTCDFPSRSSFVSLRRMIVS